MRLIKKALLAVSLSLGALWLTPPVSAQVFPYTAVLRTSLVPIDQWTDPSPEPVVANGNFIATLARSRGGRWPSSGASSAA